MISQTKGVGCTFYTVSSIFRLCLLLLLLLLRVFIHLWSSRYCLYYSFSIPLWYIFHSLSLPTHTVSLILHGLIQIIAKSAFTLRYILFTLSVSGPNPTGVPQPVSNLNLRLKSPSSTMHVSHGGVTGKRVSKRTLINQCVAVLTTQYYRWTRLSYKTLKSCPFFVHFHR